MGSGSSGKGSRIQSVPKPAQVSSSQESMPVHKKPVLARRGQSMTRAEGSSQFHDSRNLQNKKYSSTTTTDPRGSGDSLSGEDVNGDYHHSSVRNSASTGNLVDDSPELGVRSRIPVSKSSYFDGETGITRGSSRSYGNEDGHQYGHQGAATLPSRRNPVIKATARVVPTKVYKG